MEYLDIVDENNNLTGKVEERQVVHTLGLWHKEVAIWVINENNEILLQKRASTKKQAPNMWSICAGHIDSGEDIEVSALRELKEEIGMETKKLGECLVIKEEEYFSERNINRIFTYHYFCKTNMKIDEFKIQEEELSELKYISFEEFKKIIDEKTPNYTFSDDPYVFDIIKEIEKNISINIFC